MKSLIEKYGIIAAFVLLLIAFHFLLTDYIPRPDGHMGHDFHYILPHLMAGYFWIKQNGFTEIPWFSPHSCAGVPFFSHPQSMYFSLAQFLTQWCSPLKAVYITCITFATFGLLGSYALLQGVFKCSKTIALLGAALFLFNDFYFYRMVIGHFTYHSFMLIPAIMFFLSFHYDSAENIKKSLWLSAAAALLFSYMIYSGAMNLLIPTVLSLVLYGLLYSFIFEKFMHYWKRLCLTGGITILISAMKLNLAKEVMSNLPRDSYALPGFTSFLNVFWVPFKLFFISSEIPQISDTEIKLDLHEWEYGVSFIALVFIIWGIMSFSQSRLNQKKEGDNFFNKRQFISLMLFCIITIFYLSLTFYYESWNTFIKQLPVIKSTSSLFRWYCAYIPIFVVVAAIGLKRISLPKAIESSLALGFLLLLIGLNFGKDNIYYHELRYDPSHIEKSYVECEQNNKIVPITRLHVFPRRKTKNAKYKIYRDNVMVQGGSHIVGYEPLFGYSREFFPQRDKLRLAPITQLADHGYNMKNPVSYVFPKENNLKPGDHFKKGQEEALKNFASYKPYNFKMSSTQKTLNSLSLLSFATSLLYLLFGFLLGKKKNSYD